jgi:subtilisin family serine protease
MQNALPHSIFCEFSIQTGIRATHQQFNNRVMQSKDFSDNGDGSGNDLNGHGTHVVR